MRLGFPGLEFKGLRMGTPSSVVNLICRKTGNLGACESSN
jgi:hypothetical protein